MRVGALLVLLMQSSGGGIKPTRTGRRNFAVLPGYDAEGGAFSGPARSETGLRWRTLRLAVECVIEGRPYCGRSPNVAGFPDVVEEALDVKTAPFLSASMIRDATAADSRA